MARGGKASQASGDHAGTSTTGRRSNVKGKGRPQQDRYDGGDDGSRSNSSQSNRQYAQQDEQNQPQFGNGFGGTTQSNGYSNSGNMGNGQYNQPQMASPLDVLMSAIAASAGAGGGAQNIGGMQNVGNMGNGGQMYGMGNVGMGGNGQADNGPVMQSQPPPPTFTNNHSTALSLDQIFGHNGFSAAASAAQTAENNPTPLPTPFQVNLLMNLLNAQGGNNALNGGQSAQMAQQQSAPPANNQSGMTFQNPQQQGQMPSTPFQQTRSGRISRPPAQPVPFFPDWSQLQNTQGMQSQNGPQGGEAGGGSGQTQTHTQGGLFFPSQSVLRAIQVLQQPGMEAIRQALSSTDWMTQTGGNQGPTGGGTMGNYPGPVVSYRQASGGAGSMEDEREEGDSDSRGISRGNKRRRLDDQDGMNGNGAHDGAMQHDRGRTASTSAFVPMDEDNALGDDAEEDEQASPAGQTWPAPPRGKGSRLAMTKEEISARRKERNKQSALASRARRSEKIDALQGRLDAKEEEVKAAQERCKQLEQKVQSLQNYILSSGLSLPGSAPVTHQTPIGLTSTGMQTTLVRASSDEIGQSVQLSAAGAPPTDATSADGSTAMAALQPLDVQAPVDGGMMGLPSADAFSLDQALSSGNGQLFGNMGMGMGMGMGVPNGTSTFDTGADQLFDFNLFMNLDGFDDDDDDFQPETSPQHASGSESESEDEEVDGNGTPHASVKNGQPGSRKKKRSKRSRRQRVSATGTGEPDPDITPLYTDTEATPRDREDEDEFVDPEMEDEDLFLPIEDVPIPPEALAVQSAAGEESQGSASLQDLTRDMMTALNVETKDQLAAVMRKLVESAGDGVGEDVREKLRSVMYLAQANVEPSGQRQNADTHAK